jgi:hypothetical protein
VSGVARRSVGHLVRPGTTWSRLCAEASRLPGVAEGTSYRTPALFFRKKLLARLKEDGESVAISVDFFDRDVLIKADPKAFFLTDHYRAYPWVLMRLAAVQHEAAIKLLEDAWRRAAPARVVALYSRGLEAPPSGHPNRAHSSTTRRIKRAR